jgi:hypothetical protein
VAPKGPRVPRRSRRDFARVSVTAATVWAAVALFLSVVPSYVRTLLHTSDLALVAAVSALALACSFVTQALARGREQSSQPSQLAGLCTLALGLLLLVLAAPLRSRPLIVCGSIAAGVGHGLAFLNAQEELNDLAPSDRRGEVTSAFICCIYAVVAAGVLATGVLDRFASLTASLEIVAVALLALALAAAAWQLTDFRRR